MKGQTITKNEEAEKDRLGRRQRTNVWEIMNVSNSVERVRRCALTVDAKTTTIEEILGVEATMLRREGDRETMEGVSVPAPTNSLRCAESGLALAR